MELAWTPELADVTEALAVQRRAGRNSLKMAALLTGCLILLVVGLGTDSETLVEIGLGSSVAGGLVWASRPLMIRRLWRRTAALREPVTAILTPDHGIEFRTRTGSTIVRWSAVEGCSETDRVFVVRVSGHGLSLLTLAKRAAGGPEQVDDLRKILAAHVPPFAA